MRILLILMMICSALIETSCSLLSSAKPPQTTYVLSCMPAVNTSPKHRRVTLRVAYPLTSAMYLTTQMAYVNRPFGLAYYARNSWAALPAQMLQPLLVTALQQTHAFRAIIDSTSLAYADVVLDTDIIVMQLNFLRSPVQYDLVLRAQLINNHTNKVIGTKLIDVSEPVLSATPCGGAVAANHAFENAIEQVVDFSLHTIR